MEHHMPKTNYTQLLAKVVKAAAAGDKNAVAGLTALADVAAAIDDAALSGREQGLAAAAKRFGTPKA
jgi:hypothetical protein